MTTDTTETMKAPKKITLTLAAHEIELLHRGDKICARGRQYTLGTPLEGALWEAVGPRGGLYLLEFEQFVQSEDAQDAEQPATRIPWDA